MNSYKQTEQIVQPTAPAYSDRQFLHTYQTAAWVPLTQATVNAFMTMVLTAVVMFLMDSSLRDYAKPTLVVGALTWVVSWLYLQRRWFSLTALESRLQIDLNQNGVIDQPEEVRQVRVQIDEAQPNGHIRQSKLFTLPCNEEELEEISRKTKKGISFSEREYTGKNKPFSVTRFREIRTEMLRRGMLAPASAKSDKQGYVFTRAGQAVLDHYAPSPTPLGEES